MLIWGILIVVGTLNTAYAANLIYIKGSFNISTPIDQPQVLFQYVDKNKDVIFYTFGFEGKVNGPETTAINNALGTLNNITYILLDWEKEAQGPVISYLVVVANSLKVASDFGTAVSEFIKNGVGKSFRFIGLSLGAHLMGWAGEKVQELVKQNITSIIGLDPAKEGFEYDRKKGLKPSQAQLVIGIHTNARQYGINRSVGHVDFWANYDICLLDQRQPGCPLGIDFPLSRQDICSHVRSVYLFIYSYTNSFPAAFAGSCSAWHSQNSSNVVINYFGTNVDPGKPGNFYFSTTSEPPYSKGLAGITPN